ncbi:DUF4391 domain-containing protein [Porphyromonas uenonis]|uniref:DUF4391 domain-containing protein n=1 Tax=Porphyromonas uenonis TaxID=281920 RepID=UPI002673C2FA|nr:DUF4391 domain-containing protein [Porphyromonas uenonis]
MTNNPLSLPESTIVDCNVPKNAFYKRESESQKNALRTFLTDSVKEVRWLYKLHPSTLPLAVGAQVEEIDIFLCTLKETPYDTELLRRMDALMPRPSLFLIAYEECVDLLIFPRSRNSQGGMVQTGRMEQRIDVDLTKCPISIVGYSMDAVYGNLLGQLSQLGTNTVEGYLAKANLRDQVHAIRKKCDTLRRKMRKEPQYNRQCEIRRQIRQLEKEIEGFGDF